VRSRPTCLPPAATELSSAAQHRSKSDEMGFFKSTKLAWSIAIASLALWAASAPLSSGQTLPFAARLLQQTTDQTTSTTSLETADNQTTATQSDNAVLAQDTTTCPAPPGAMTQPPAPEPAPPVASASSATEGTFQLCGPDDKAAHAIEQLIAGRSFSASLSSSGSGCASLTIKATSAAVTSGRASSTLNVSLGSGQRLSIQINSEGGMTHVTIGPAA
jgi:hypothetical protein